MVSAGVRESESEHLRTQSAAPATSRFTKCCACHENLHFEVHKVPRNLHFEFHKVLCLRRNLHFEVHKVLCLRRNLHFEVHEVLHLSRNLHCKVHKVLRLPRNLQTSHMSKSHDSLHLSRNQSASTIATMSEVLRLPRNLHFELKPLRSLAPVTGSTLGPATKSRPQTTKAWGFPCVCHEK